MCCSGCPGTISDIATMNSGRESTALIQNRRFISTSSGLGSSSRLTVLGSKAIPQIGHDPGSSRTISGCIGQTYSIFAAGVAGVSGSSAMPHFGQAPGLGSRTSGSMGQMYSAPTGFAVAGVCRAACASPWACSAVTSCHARVRRVARRPTCQDLL